MNEHGGNAPVVTPKDAESDLEHELTVGREIVLATIRKHFSRLPWEDAENIAQDICIDYWQQRSRIRVYQAWFYAAARNGAVSALRRKRPSREMTDGDATTAEPMNARQEAIRQLFLNLQGHCRQLLGCLVIAGWSLPELAKAVSRDVNRLNRQRARCLNLLRERWKDADGADTGKVPVYLTGHGQTSGGM